MDIAGKIAELRSGLPEGITLVAVSKTHPVDAVMEAYNAGQRVFGESRPQELKTKYESLPKDIRWHMIGHLQTNKVKYIAPFVELIHSVDSHKLLEVINKEAIKNNRIIDVLMEVFVAQEQTKHGWEPTELKEYVTSGTLKDFTNIRIRGVMGIATYTDDEDLIRSEFSNLHNTFCSLKANLGKEFDVLSMGMTSDYKIAVECGSTTVRVGSLIFGDRE